MLEDTTMKKTDSKEPWTLNTKCGTKKVIMNQAVSSRKTQSNPIIGDTRYLNNLGSGMSESL